MASLEWHAALAQNLPAMDETHQEFVELLAQVEAASDAHLPALWQELVVHTQAHFAQEDGWMLASGFASGNCHAMQHKVVLDILQEATQQLNAGDVAMLRGLLPELARWFDQHAQTMDAALAEHMQRVGLDVASGQLLHAQALPAQRITGCGGACSSPAA